MTRLRYIVDRPRGKRGGHKDERYLYTNRRFTEGAAAARPAVIRGDRQIREARPAGVVLEVDLDALLPVDASAEEQFAWHECRMLHHATELQRLRPHAERNEAPHLSTSDMARIREAVSEWHAEEDRLRRGGGATPAASAAFFLLRDLWREGKLG